MSIAASPSIVTIQFNPQGKFGRQEYKLGEFGFTPGTVRPRFERYRFECDFEPEG